jgi:DNA-binding XRE family transcriptional regulator
MSLERTSLKPTQPPIRDVTTCPACHLCPFVVERCRRCRHPLGITYFEVPIPLFPAQSSKTREALTRSRVGKMIRDLRRINNKTQGSLARSLETHRTHVCRVEKGRVLLSLSTTLQALAILGVDKIYLRFRKPEP